MEVCYEREPNLLSLSSNNKKAASKAAAREETCRQQTPVIILINIKSIDTNKTSPQNEHNYLRHFRKIYEEKGWITVQCTPTEDRIERGEALEIVSTLFVCLENRAIHNNPIIMHVLGHEGLAVHNAFCEFVKDEQDLGSSFSICGCILDSCPRQPTGLLDSMKHILPNVYSFIMLIVCLIRTIFPELFARNSENNDYEKFCYCSGMWPQLYLYSLTDHIVPYTDVEKAANIRLGSGATVELKCWDDTEHVRHLFVHQQEYTELCQQFVLRCLGLE